MRYQRLNGLCNARRSVPKAFMEYFSCLFHRWFTLYRQAHGTVENVNQCLTKAVAECGTNPAAAVAAFDAANAPESSGVTSVDFTDIENKK